MLMFMAPLAFVSCVQQLYSVIWSRKRRRQRHLVCPLQCPQNLRDNSNPVALLYVVFFGPHRGCHLPGLSWATVSARSTGAVSLVYMQLTVAYMAKTSCNMLLLILQHRQCSNVKVQFLLTPEYLLAMYALCRFTIVLLYFFYIFTH